MFWDFKYNFKGLTLFLSLLFLWGCEDIPRDNVLDPRNPNSYRKQKVLIEAFVNISNPYQYNEFMLQALDSLQRNYPDDVVILEYHRNVPSFPDPDARTENEILYLNYINAIDPASRGVPDVFFNGISQRVQGASAVEHAYFRLQSALSGELTRLSHFTIELDYRITEEQIQATVRLARLGNEPVKDFLIKAILKVKKDNQYLKRVVQAMASPLAVPEMNPGEIREFKLQPLPYFLGFQNTVVIYLTSADGLVVHQCEEFIVD